MVDRLYDVELAQFRNGEFAGWQQFEGFASKRDAWDFIKSHGFTARQKGIDWNAYPSVQA